MICKSDWYFLLTQWGNPGSFLRYLKEENRLPRQLADLVNVPQDPEWHPEGCAFSHTCCVVDSMADILSREGISGDRRVMFMLAAVCHDMGKAVSTVMCPDKGRWRSPGHDVTGVPIAQKFLENLKTSHEVILQVLPLVRWHMAHTRQSFTFKAVRKLARELQPCTIADLLLLMRADCMGRGSASSDLPTRVNEELVVRAKESGWLNGPHEADLRSPDPAVYGLVEVSPEQSAEVIDNGESE